MQISQNSRIKLYKLQIFVFEYNFHALYVRKSRQLTHQRADRISLSAALDSYLFQASQTARFTRLVYCFGLKEPSPRKMGING